MKAKTFWPRHLPLTICKYTCPTNFSFEATMIYFTARISVRGLFWVFERRKSFWKRPHTRSKKILLRHCKLPKRLRACPSCAQIGMLSLRSTARSDEKHCPSVVSSPNWHAHCLFESKKSSIYLIHPSMATQRTPATVTSQSCQISF